MSNDLQSSYKAPNSNLAVVSIIAGILGFTLFPLMGSIIALVTGYMARNEIQESGGSLGGDGLATAGIILGWIGVGMSVIGFCIAGVVIGLSFCMIPFGIMLDNTLIIPSLALFF